MERTFWKVTVDDWADSVDLKEFETEHAALQFGYLLANFELDANVRVWKVDRTEGKNATFTEIATWITGEGPFTGYYGGYGQ